MNHPSRAPSSRPRWLTVVGILGVVCMGFTVWLGLWITPPDAVQGNLARLLYIHPPIATVALYWAGGVALAGSLFYLWPRTRSFFWDRLAAASVEVGAVFSALTCITGSIWGRPAWGVWWAWDARLTSTALLFLLELGYLALRRVPADPAIRARRCAVAALLIALDVPIVHFSVDWWQTLHQTGTVLDPGFHLHVHGSMAWTFLLGFIAFSLVFVWLLGVRYRIEVLQDQVGDQEMEVSLAERWSEGTDGSELRRRRSVRASRPRRGCTVSYVDAGYSIALGMLFLYAVALVLRRRRWERACGSSSASSPPGAPKWPSAPRRPSASSPPRTSSAPSTPRSRRPPAHGRDQHHQRAEPLPRSIDRRPSSGARTAPRPPPEQQAPMAGLRRPAGRVRLPAGRGARELPQLLRHRRPGLRPSGHPGHPDLQPRG